MLRISIMSSVTLALALAACSTPTERTGEAAAAVTSACAPCITAALTECSAPAFDLADCVGGCSVGDTACLEACLDAATIMGQQSANVARCTACDHCAAECAGAWDCSTTWRHNKH